MLPSICLTHLFCPSYVMDQKYGVTNVMRILKLYKGQFVDIYCTSSQTANSVVLGECGRLPLYTCTL